MTTTAHEDQFTPSTQTIEIVHAPYEPVAILKRNVAELELALKRQTERAEKAEGELAELQATLAKLREQKPVAHIDYWKSDGTLIARRQETSGGKLYAAPVPVPHKGATHCDDCGLTWLDDGLNPLGCPYCKDTVPAPAVPTNTIPEGDDFNGTTPHMIRCIESLVSMNDRGVLAPHGLCGHSRTLLLASANRLRQQQAHVVPAEWRKVMAELAADLQAACDAEHPHRDQYPSVMRKYNNDMEIVEKARALLQSAEVRHD